MQRKMMLLINPNAGKGVYKTVLGGILEVFCTGGWLPSVYFTQEAGQAPELVAANAADYDMVVCMGGDGTLSETAAGMLRSGAHRPIGYIPLGTANDVARTLGLSSRPVEAAENILRGSPFAYDIGQFGADSFFTYVAAFGAFTEVSYATPQEAKHALGHMAYMLEGIRGLGRISATRARVRYDDGELDGEFIFGAVTNSTSVAGLVRLDDQTVDLSDGKFELLLVRRPMDILDLSDIVGHVLSADFSGPNVVFVRSASVQFHFDTPVAWTRDGEDGGTHTEVDIGIRHPGVTLIV